MRSARRHPWIFLINVLIFFTVIMFDSNGILDISIKNATPLIALPLLTAFAVFGSLRAACIVGLITGALIDSTAGGTYCFNTISFFVLGVGVYLAANNLFNKNLRAVTALTVIVAVFYYVAYWLTFMAIGVGIENSLIYLLSYGLPSALYSAAFIFPFFFIYRHFNKLQN